MTDSKWTRIEDVDAALVKYGILSKDEMRLVPSPSGRSAGRQYSVGYSGSSSAGSHLEEVSGIFATVQVYAGQIATIKFSGITADPAVMSMNAATTMELLVNRATKALQKYRGKTDNITIGRFIILRYYPLSHGHSITDEEAVKLTELSMSTRHIITLLKTGAPAKDVIEADSLPTYLADDIFQATAEDVKEEQEVSFADKLRNKMGI